MKPGGIGHYFKPVFDTECFCEETKHMRGKGSTACWCNLWIKVPKSSSWLFPHLVASSNKLHLKDQLIPAHDCTLHSLERGCDTKPFFVGCTIELQLHSFNGLELVCNGPFQMCGKKKFHPLFLRIIFILPEQLLNSRISHRLYKWGKWSY